MKYSFFEMKHSFFEMKHSLFRKEDSFPGMKLSSPDKECSSSEEKHLFPGGGGPAILFEPRGLRQGCRVSGLLHTPRGLHLGTPFRAIIDQTGSGAHHCRRVRGIARERFGFYNPLTELDRTIRLFTPYYVVLPNRSAFHSLLRS